MRKPIGIAVLLAFGIAVLAGCTAHPTVVPLHGAVVTGTLIFGGPGRIKPVPGQVTAVNPVSGRFTVTADDNGRFRLYLPAGSYRLTGHSRKVTLNGSEVECSAAHLIHVTLGKTTQGIKVICHLI